MNCKIVVVVLFMSCCVALAQDGSLGVPDAERAGVRLDLHSIPSRLVDSAAAERPAGYVIGAKDELSVFVWNEPDLTVDVFVRPDGKISVPLLNDVAASGLTPMQLQQRITEGLQDFVATPQVSVIVKTINSRVVYLYGRGVASPGVYTLGSPTNVMQLLIEAGGFAEFADEDKIQVLRTVNGQPEWFLFNAEEFIKGENFEQNIQLQSGDLVIVP